MSTGTVQELLLAAQAVEVQAGAKVPTVSMLAYTGGLMRVGGYGVVCIDLAGLDLGGNRVVLLADHNSALDGVLGQGVAAVQGGQLTVRGELVATNEAAQRVLELARAGFQFQASVGCEPLELERVGAGKELAVNGRNIVAPEGGFTLLAKSRLREVSILALGADAGTAVRIAAAKRTGEERMEMTAAEASKIRMQERERIAEIEALCEGYEHNHQVRMMKAQAINEEIPLRELNATVLAVLRAARPQAPLVASGRGCAPTSARTITAALLCRMGLERLGEKTLGAEAMEGGHRMRGAHLLDLCKAALEADGAEVPAGRQDLIRAALSTYSLPTALGDLAHKLLLDAYQESEATWPSFCAVRSVSDFKENVGVRPSFTGQLEPIPPGGELKHGGISEALFKFHIDTFGKMLAIDRRDLINDDLSIFDQTARALGQAARRKLSDLVYGTLLNENGGFFNDDHANLLVGAASGLGLDSLGQALGLMRVQKDDEGNDLDLKPAVLVVPPELEIQAREILESELKQGNPGEPTKNVLKNAVALEVEPRLSNTRKFKSKASKKQWFLFAAPAACPLVVAFLNGQTEPTVEFFGLDATPNRLAASWRVFHDFGAALCDPRAGVRSAGQ